MDGGGLVALGPVRAFRNAGTNVETPKPAIALVTGEIYAPACGIRCTSPSRSFFAAIGVLADSG